MYEKKCHYILPLALILVDHTVQIIEKCYGNVMLFYNSSYPP